MKTSIIIIIIISCILFVGGVSTGVYFYIKHNKTNSKNKSGSGSGSGSGPAPPSGPKGRLTDLCIAGNYVIPTQGCRPCPIGMYSTKDFAKECKYCERGKSNKEIASTTCQDCEPGTYNDGNTSGICVKCPAGMEAPSSGAIKCIECKPGYYSDSPGSQCKECPKGTYSFGFKNTKCTFCPGGTTSPSGSVNSSSCKNCPKNYYSYKNENGEQICQACSPTQFSFEKSTKCYENTVPEPCIPGEDCLPNIKTKNGTILGKDYGKDLGLEYILPSEYGKFSALSVGNYGASKLQAKDLGNYSTNPNNNSPCENKDKSLTGNCLSMPCRINPNYIKAKYCQIPPGKKSSFSKNYPGISTGCNNIAKISGYPNQCTKPMGPLPYIPNRDPLQCYTQVTLGGAQNFYGNMFSSGTGIPECISPVINCVDTGSGLSPDCLKGLQTAIDTDILSPSASPSEIGYKKCWDAIKDASRNGETCVYWDDVACNEIKGNKNFNNIATEIVNLEEDSKPITFNCINKVLSPSN